MIRVILIPKIAFQSELDNPETVVVSDEFLVEAVFELCVSFRHSVSNRRFTENCDWSLPRGLWYSQQHEDFSRIVDLHSIPCADKLDRKADRA
jgi:hypothetical protein